MLAPVLKAAATAPVVSLAEIKEHCRCEDFSDDDEILMAMLQAANDHLTGWTGTLGRCLINEVWASLFACWPADRMIALPFPDVSDATIKYHDHADDEQTVQSSDFSVHEGPSGSLIFLKDSFAFPALANDRLDKITVEFTAGYGAAEDVPGSIKHAIKMMVAHWYENREAVAFGGSPLEMPVGASTLLGPYRRRAP